MKVAVIGSRDASSVTVEEIINELPVGTSELISGGAEGIDTMAEHAAKQLSLPLSVFAPNYSLFGRSAPIFRNQKIVNSCDYLLAFWDGASKGTAYTIKYCIETDKPFRIIRIKKSTS